MQDSTTRMEEVRPPIKAETRRQRSVTRRALAETALAHATDSDPVAMARSTKELGGTDVVDVPKPRLIRKNGVLYVSYAGSALRQDSNASGEAILQNLKSGLSTRLQKRAVDDVVRPIVEGLYPK